MGSNGQMGALGLESVFVGDVGDGVGHAVFTNEAEGSTDAEDSILNSSGLNLGGLVALWSVAQFIVVFVAVETNVVMESFLHDDNFLGVDGSTLREGKGNSQDGDEDGDLLNSVISLVCTVSI